MLDYVNLRNVFKGSAKINSEHLVLAEWNMNKYQTISQYGVYVNTVPATIYNPNDGNITSGQNYLLYDDGTTKVPDDQEYFSQLSSVFQPNRPDPGIILLQKYQNNLITSNGSRLRSGNVNPSQPRYYAFSEFREYDYWNSAKNFVTQSGFTRGGGLSDAKDGTYQGVHPFVVYQDIFPCNKITLKVQNHISRPVKFSIEILQETSTNVYTWVTAYTNVQSSATDFASGELNIYYNPSSGTWVKVAPNTDIGTYVVDNLESLDDASPTEFKLIKGLRLIVNQMSIVTVGTQNYPASLELIEMSPRLEANMSAYTESFNFDSSLGDSTNFGLPVGSIVASTGTLSVSNEDGIFLFSGKLSELNMLSPDVKFMFYQIVNDGTSDKAIPLKVLYSNRWDISEDYSATISLEDGFKFLRETAAPDILLHSVNGQPLSITILFLLDNAGITGYRFLKTSNDADSEDTLIRSFFSKREQTVAEVLEELALATQCSMYFDVVGRLTVLTKERLTKKVAKTESTSTVEGTDFWIVLDEDYTKPGGGNVAEYNSISAYTSNVVSYSETQLNPVTDGDIVYHTYGPPKSSRLDEFPDQALNRITEQTTFPLSLALANFGYNTSIVWNAAEGNDGSLGAANLESNLTGTRVKDAFTSTYTAANEEDAVRLLYRNANSTQKESMVIKLDANEGLTIGPYQGTVLIGNEFIKYNGKLFRISSTPSQNNSLQIPVNTNKILFSQEEFQQEIRNIGTGGSIHLIGLIVDVQFKIEDQTDGNYQYKVVGDGRGKLGSQIQPHAAVVENQTGLSENLRYGLALGDKYNSNFPKPNISIKHNFLDRVRYKSAYRQLQKRGLFSKFSSESYLGFLKMTGRVNEKDKSVIDKLYGEGNTSGVGKELAEINKQTDEKVPGDFDDFVYLEGERNIYGQKVQLGFKPNIISTRMRLFSPRRRKVNQSLAAETLSSIAGIAFGVNKYGEGYYLEVEGVGSGKDNVEKEGYKNNLRFYKVTINDKGVYEPNLIFAAPVGAYVVENVDVQILKSVKGNVDPFFDLSIVVEYPQNGELARYTIRYGDTRIGRFTESKKEAIDGNTVALFVRGDSQAIFEYLSAASRPIGGGDIALFRGFNRIDEKLKAGILPINEQYLYKNDIFTYYFNDFAKLVREVRDYDIRFTFPAYASKLIDVSEVNSQYMIKKYNATAFGARLVVVNTSPGPIILTEQSNNPLYVVAVAMEELSSGTVNMEDFIDKVDEKRRKIVDREKNKSIYGSQSFSIDSQYMQTLSQARRLMRWIIRYCSRPRIQLNMEIFSNPLLELGDKVKIYDKSRGYYEDNPRFGNKTFVVSAINYSVGDNGPVMNVDVIEVGEV